LNTGITFGPAGRDSLVNNGSGKNYGIELTLERFFNQGYYFLVTSSLFNSRYTGSDGIERNTAYNTKYVVNALGGKEWSLKGGKSISLNLKATTIGGPYLTPLDLELSKERGVPIRGAKRLVSGVLTSGSTFDHLSSSLKGGPGVFYGSRT
jgi:hypothetical protein